MPSWLRVIETRSLPISTWRFGACTSRFYSVVVDDERSITFDGDTSLRRGLTGHKDVRRARWSILGALAKECRYSYYKKLNIGVDATTPMRYSFGSFQQ